MDKVLEIIKNDKAPTYVALGLLALTAANELWDLTAINGVVVILGLFFFALRKFSN